MCKISSCSISLLPLILSVFIFSPLHSNSVVVYHYGFNLQFLTNVIEHLLMCLIAIHIIIFGTVSFLNHRLDFGRLSFY